MRRRTASLVGVILTVTTTSAAAQWLNYPTRGIPRTADGKPNLSAPAPKTAEGKPDLSGIWNLTTTAGLLRGNLYETGSSHKAPVANFSASAARSSSAQFCRAVGFRKPYLPPPE